MVLKWLWAVVPPQYDIQAIHRYVAMAGYSSWWTSLYSAASGSRRRSTTFPSFRVDTRILMFSVIFSDFRTRIAGRRVTGCPVLYVSFTVFLNVQSGQNSVFPHPFGRDALIHRRTSPQRCPIIRGAGFSTIAKAEVLAERIFTSLSTRKTGASSRSRNLFMLNPKSSKILV